MLRMHGSSAPASAPEEPGVAWAERPSPEGSSVAAILERVAVGFFTLDREQRFTYINAWAEALLNRGREGLLGRRIWDAFPVAAELEFYDRYQEATRTGALASFEMHYPPLGRWFSVNVFPHDGGGSVCFRDVTERRRLEREVLEVAEAERQRLGRDLHDGAGARLTGIAMMAEGLARSLRAGACPSPEDLEEIAHLAGEGAAQVRALARGLCPVKLDERSLEAALQELATSACAVGRVACSFSCDDGLPTLDVNVNSQLYWIGQEAVNNALKHAGASRIDVRLRKGSRLLLLVVEDDGGGLPPSATEGQSGMGLRTMRYRAEQIGANLRIRRGAGGTRVTCALPLAPQR